MSDAVDPRAMNRVVDLLRMREDAFVRVYDCEQRIRDILGVEFPFPAPPALPSGRRSGRSSSGKPGRVAALAALKPGLEDAYRLRLSCGGLERESLHTDAALVRSLRDGVGAAVQVLSAETVRFRADGTPVAVRRLWSAGEGVPGGASASCNREPGT